MMVLRCHARTFLALLACASPLLAQRARPDSVILANGTVLRGNVILQEPRQWVLLETTDGVRRTLEWDDVSRVVIGPRRAQPGPIAQGNSGPIVFTAIAAGESHSCAIASTGAAFCWGKNEAGQLGDGTKRDRTRPTLVVEDIKFMAITPAYGHTCGLSKDGVPYCWGPGGAHIGTDDREPQLAPNPVKGTSRFAQIGSGLTHNCGLSTEGVVSCWGRGADGQLGDGSNGGHSMPAPIATELRFHQVSTGYYNACALTATGQAYCWGSDIFGANGGGAVAHTGSLPGLVSGGHTFAHIATGNYTACALTPEGAAWCWGHNEFGQVGDGASLKTSGVAANRNVPAAVKTTLRFSFITAGSTQTCALTPEGEAYCWGLFQWGTGGEPLDMINVTPVAVKTPVRFALLTIGGSHVCGLTKEGVAYCWGENRSGELGDGTLVGKKTPVRVIEP